jgi:hypothetical protein
MYLQGSTNIGFVICSKFQCFIYFHLFMADTMTYIICWTILLLYDHAKFVLLFTNQMAKFKIGLCLIWLLVTPQYVWRALHQRMWQRFWHLLTWTKITLIPILQIKRFWTGNTVMQHKHNKMVIMRGNKTVAIIASAGRVNNYCRHVCECYWGKRSCINCGPKKKKTWNGWLWMEHWRP